MKKAMFKFNNSTGALICSGCFIILKSWSEMTDGEKMRWSEINN